MTDTWLNGTDPHPPTTEEQGPPVAPPPVPPASDVNTPLPVGVHPRDNSVPYVPGQSQPSIDSNRAVADNGPPAQGERRRPVWNTDNEEALPVFVRAAHSWSIRTFTLTLAEGPIQVVGRQRGATSTVLWCPSSAALGALIAPEPGELSAGAGGALFPGDSLELATEAPVYAWVISGNSTGTIYVVRLFNPPGGGLGI